MNIRSLVTTAIIALIAAASTTQAANRHVPASYPTIQAGIDAANDGDTVIIASGTYTGNGNRDIDFKGKAITVKGNPEDPAQVIIDCQGEREDQHRGFIFVSGEQTDSVLEGLVVTRAYGYPGSAIYSYQSSPTIRWCEFTDNYVDDSAVIVCYEGSPVIEYCLISKNMGTALRFSGGILNIHDCTIKENLGRGLFFSGGNSQVENCKIIGNQGHGLNIFGGDCLIKNSHISDNHGSGLYFSGRYAVLEDCKIVDNGNRDNNGGGIYCSGGSLDVVGSVIGNNKAEEGGAVYSQGGNTSFYNSVLEGNRAYGLGGGFAYGSGSWKFNNCVVLGHKGSLFSGKYFDHRTAKFSNCIIGFDVDSDGYSKGTFVSSYWGYLFDNVTVNYCCVIGATDYVQGEGNIIADPMFVRHGRWIGEECNNEWEAGDYHLLFESPCIDKGSDVTNSSYTEFDMDDKPRPIDGNRDGVARTDIGVYEVGSLYEPILGVSKQVAYISVAEDGERTERFEIEVFNRGAGVLDWFVEGNDQCQWLDISKVSGNGTDKILLVADASGLARGIYESYLTVSDVGSLSSPKQIPVHLTVNREHNVPDDYANIQAAIDESIDGDIITVSDGVYGGDGNWDIDFLGKALTVRSENGAESCIIDCKLDGEQSGDHSGFLFHNMEDRRSIVDGFTITNSVASPFIKTIAYCGYSVTMQTYDGGAVRCDQSSPTIQNCIIVGNEAGRGGGVFVKKASPLFINCQFAGNTADRGAGAFIISASPAFVSCVFEYNTADDGSGVLCDGGNAVFDRCSFNLNSSRGTSTILYTAGGTKLIDLPVGGGLSVRQASPKVNNCVFSGNKVQNYGGGALLLSGSNVITSNSIFIGNRASGNNSFGGMCFDSQLNYSNLDGSQRRFGDNVFSNCVFWESINDQGQDNWDAYSALENIPFRIDYSCVQGMTAWLGLGNIDADPLFVDAGYWHDSASPADPNDDYWVNGDYHLRSAGWRWDDLGGQWTWDGVTSPCIDAGNPGMALADEPTTVEVDPLNRFGVNKRINMGAYGGTAEASMAPPGFALLADITNDGTVDTADLAILMQSWLTTEQNSYADFTRDANIDFADFALMAHDWLSQTTWFAP